MMHLYVLFPQEYGLELEPERAVGSIEEGLAEAFGQEARVLAWQVLDGAAPDTLPPEMMMTAMKAVAEEGGIEPFLPGEGSAGQITTYVTLECPPEVRVGVCVFSDERLEERPVPWRPTASADEPLASFEEAYRGCMKEVEGNTATFDTECLVSIVRDQKEGASRFVIDRCKRAQEDPVRLQAAVVVAMAFRFVFEDSSLLERVVKRAAELGALDEIKSATAPWAEAQGS